MSKGQSGSAAPESMDDRSGTRRDAPITMFGKITSCAVASFSPLPSAMLPQLSRQTSLGPWGVAFLIGVRACLCSPVLRKTSEAGFGAGRITAGTTGSLPEVVLAFYLGTRRVRLSSSFLELLLFITMPAGRRLDHRGRPADTA